jgi:crotonobetainyl-CoA:carnitine CoA-transferase CaiB-like acyl-CoA transferase
MALADMVAGLTGAFATMVALREVECETVAYGQVVWTCPLLEPMLAIMGPDVTAHAATGRVAEPNLKIASPRGVYRCRDGRWVAIVRLDRHDGAARAGSDRSGESGQRPALPHERGNGSPTTPLSTG